MNSRPLSDGSSFLEVAVQIDVVGLRYIVDYQKAVPELVGSRSSRACHYYSQRAPLPELGSHRLD